MTTTAEPQQTLLTRPKRADARRNYEKVLAAAREAFLEGGEATSLEEIARRAGVGIGTLYRHFPNRQSLLEALYAGEVEQLSQSAAELDGEDPWTALSMWFERFIVYLATKRALAEELMHYMDKDAPFSLRAVPRCSRPESRCSSARRTPAPCARTSSSVRSCTW